MSETVEEPTSQPVHDPVCHKDFPATEAAASQEYDGYTYYFCSEECFRSFEANPVGVIEAETGLEHGPSRD